LEDLFSNLSRIPVSDLEEFDYNGDDIEVVLTVDSAKFLVNSINTDSELSIKYNKTFFCVYFEDVSIEITQLAVNFPNYKKIINSLDKKKVFEIGNGKRWTLPRGNGRRVRWFY